MTSRATETVRSETIGSFGSDGAGGLRPSPDRRSVGTSSTYPAWFGRMIVGRVRQRAPGGHAGRRSGSGRNFLRSHVDPGVADALASSGSSDRWMAHAYSYRHLLLSGHSEHRNSGSTPLGGISHPTPCPQAFVLAGRTRSNARDPSPMVLIFLARRKRNIGDDT